MTTVAEFVRMLQAADPSGQAVVDIAVFDEDDPDGSAVMLGEPERIDCEHKGVMENGPTASIRIWNMRIG